MAMLGVYVVLTCFALTFAQNCTLNVDQFCSLDSSLVECFCDSYREQLVQLFTDDICPLISRLSPSGRGNSSVVEVIEKVRAETSDILSQGFRLFCPSVGEFETCVNTNFQTSNRELDRIIKPYVSNNIGSLAREVCEAASDFQSLSECSSNLVVPIMGCSFSALNLNRPQPGGPSPVSACPYIGDIGSCSFTQISTICSRNVGDFLTRAMSTYLSQSCSNLADGSQRFSGSGVVQCAITLGSGLLTSTDSIDSIGFVRSLVGGEQVGASNIVSAVLPTVCKNIERAIGCIGETIDASTNIVDILIRRMVDIPQLQRQASNIQTAFCSEQTRNGLLQVVNCTASSSGTQFQSCDSSVRSLGNTLVTSTADDNSIRTRICRPFLEASQCVARGISTCNAYIATLQTELVQGLMRFQECGRTGTGRFSTTGTAATKVPNGLIVYLLALFCIITKEKLI